MEIGDRPLHCLGCKVSHNTYEFAFDLDDLYEAGCRGIELDIHQEADTWEWRVSHRAPDASSKLLSAYLAQLREWSNAKDAERREPFFVAIDLKKGKWSHPDFPDQLDAYLAAYFPENSRLLSPYQLIFDEDNLFGNAMRHGWPTLNEARGTLIFWITGNGKGKRNYARTNPGHRLCFADDDTADAVIPEFDDRILLNTNFNVLEEKYAELSTYLREFRALLARAYNINHERQFDRVRQVAPRINLLAVSPKLARDKQLAGSGFWDTHLPE